jgi:hypothetical protein
MSVSISSYTKTHNWKSDAVRKSHRHHDQRHNWINCRDLRLSWQWRYMAFWLDVFCSFSCHGLRETDLHQFWEERKLLPEEWKESIIVPTHKKGDKTDCNNYRGISHLPTTYNILSNILLSRLIPYAKGIIGPTPWPAADPGDQYPYKNLSFTSPFHSRRQALPEDLLTQPPPHPPNISNSGHQKQLAATPLPNTI